MENQNFSANRQAEMERNTEATLMKQRQQVNNYLADKSGALSVRWGNYPAPPTLEAATATSLSVLSYSPTIKLRLT